ncbi:MAG: DUF3833 family protein [Cypionkella sp.]|nr:DUF3833 family protein [Cypionkella sp.]
MKRRLLLGGAMLAGGMALVGCASVPPAPKTKAAPLTLLEAFTGRATGTGLFRVWLTGDQRSFTAQLNGTVTGKAGARRLTVVEDFLYDDGDANTLTWVFDEVGASADGAVRWTGRREDTVGLAEVVEQGGVIRLTYTADFVSPSGTTRLGFSDVIYDAGAGLIVNDAIVTRWGIPVAKVQFKIQR